MQRTTPSVLKTCFYQRIGNMWKYFKVNRLSETLTKECKSVHLFTAITCPAPSSGENTVDLPDDVLDGLSYLEPYTYSCKEGYTTTDELCTICQPDGSLSTNVPPVCKGKLSITTHLYKLK